MFVTIDMSYDAAIASRVSVALTAAGFLLLLACVGMCCIGESPPDEEPTSGWA